MICNCCCYVEYCPMHVASFLSKGHAGATIKAGSVRAVLTVLTGAAKALGASWCTASLDPQLQPPSCASPAAASGASPVLYAPIVSKPLPGRDSLRGMWSKLILTLFVLPSFAGGYDPFGPFSATVQAPTPPATEYGACTSFVTTAPQLLNTVGSIPTVLTINGVPGYNMISVFCQPMQAYEFSQPLYPQVAVAGQTINSNGGTAVCTWMNNGGGGAEGYVSASVVFVNSACGTLAGPAGPTGPAGPAGLASWGHG